VLRSLKRNWHIDRNGAGENGRDDESYQSWRADKNPGRVIQSSKLFCPFNRLKNDQMAIGIQISNQKF
jgi:hypothetical protein